MADERDNGRGAVERRRPVRRVFNEIGPRRSPLEQHPRDGRERLSGDDTRRIRESPAVEVIAPFHYEIH
jgi:hypothetical protein